MPPLISTIHPGPFNSADERIFDHMAQISLCLTGTIVPASDMVHRRDVALRVSDYKTALEFYLNSTPYPVVFAENSEYDIEGDADLRPLLDHPRLRVMRVPPHRDTSRGKGFQEFHMLDQVVGSGALGERFAKITGRYIVENATAILSKSLKPLHIDLHRKMRVALTGFFLIDTALYRSFVQGAYAEANDAAGRYIEHVLYDRITARPELYVQTDLLPANPRYVGVPGSHGGSLNRHPVKMWLRARERALNRRLGIQRFLIEY